MKAFMLTIIAMMPAAAFSQDIRTANLRWTVNGLHDMVTNADENYDAVFETTGTGNILWKQRNGTSITTMNVGSVTGTWTNVMVTGSVAYAVTIDGQSGTITFSRNATGVFVVLDVQPADGPRLYHRYTITAVNVN